MDKGKAYMELKAAQKRMKAADLARTQAIEEADDATAAWAIAREKYYRACGLT